MADGVPTTDRFLIGGRSAAAVKVTRTTSSFKSWTRSVPPSTVNWIPSGAFVDAAIAARAGTADDAFSSGACAANVIAPAIKDAIVNKHVARFMLHSLIC